MRASNSRHKALHELPLFLEIWRARFPFISLAKTIIHHCALCSFAMRFSAIACTAALGPSSQYAVCAHRGLRSQLISSYDIPGSHVDNQQHEIVEAASLVPDHQALRIHKAILPVSARHMILSGTFAQQS